MKNLYSSALHCKGKYFSSRQLLNGFIHNATLLFCSMILIGFLFTGCKKENVAVEEAQSINSHAAVSEGDVLNKYTSLSAQTISELQQARAATAKYRDIANAIRDGYADIEVDVEHMGHHFMNTSLVDAVFDIRKPEILVYNKDDQGNQQLVAVEYAVPLTNPRPEGFTGSDDVWKDDSGFPFWLVHAWVWAFNPDGAFNWTNPTVELH